MTPREVIVIRTGTANLASMIAGLKRAGFMEQEILRLTFSALLLLFLFSVLFF